MDNYKDFFAERENLYLKEIQHRFDKYRKALPIKLTKPTEITDFLETFMRPLRKEFVDEIEFYNDKTEDERQKKEYFKYLLESFRHSIQIEPEYSIDAFLHLTYSEVENENKWMNKVEFVDWLAKAKSYDFFIKNRFQLLNEKEKKILLKESKGSPELSLKKIEWLGSQKELGELFVELKRKGWIEGVEYNTIKAAFTNSKTIHQVLKPSTDPLTYEEQYEEIFKPRYRPKFNAIRENR